MISSEGELQTLQTSANGRLLILEAALTWCRPCKGLQVSTGWWVDMQQGSICNGSGSSDQVWSQVRVGCSQRTRSLQNTTIMSSGQSFMVRCTLWPFLDATLLCCRHGVDMSIDAVCNLQGTKLITQSTSSRMCSRREPRLPSSSTATESCCTRMPAQTRRNWRLSYASMQPMAS